MYKYTLTIIRPDNTVQWHQTDPATADYIKTNYNDTGIFTMNLLSAGTDDLFMVREIEFMDHSAFLSFMNDPTIQAYLAERRQYESDNGIFRYKEVMP